MTIVIPCYKHAHYLAECLASLVAQTYPAWKAIVVDDASPDGEEMQRVVTRLGDSRVRIVRHEENRGLAASRNTGIGSSETEFVLPLDADDKLEPDCLESLVPVIEKDGMLDCVFPDVRKFGRTNEVTAFPGPPNGKKLVRVEDTLPGAGTLMRRGFWERVGRYDENEVLRRGREDFEFYIRAFRNGCKFSQVTKPLYLYRISHTSMARACAFHDDEVFRYIYDKHRELFDSLGETRNFLSVGHDSAALASHFEGNRVRALRMALRAFKLSPSKGRAKAIARSILSPSLFGTLRSGELRRLLPFVGYPLRGRERYRPFFLIGVARSGNTLLRRVLTANSKLHIPPETFVLGSCIQKFRLYGRRMTWPDLVSLVMAEFAFHPEFHTFDLWLGPLANRLSNCPRRHRNLAYLIDAFYRFHAEEHGGVVERWGDKTPMNSLDDALVRGDPPRRIGHGVPETLERIRKVFPDAQFLHIYRDGCDVAHSHLSGGFMSNVEEAANRWLHVIRQSRNFVQRHPEQCHEIRYEDLITKPEDTVRDACRFLDVDYEPVMVTSERSAQTLGDVPEWYWHKQVHDPINPRNPGKGRTNFTSGEKELVQRIIGEELEAVGYPPATAGAETPQEKP